MIDSLSVSVEEVFEICQRHFTNIDITLRAPKNTPLEKCYLWKHVIKLTRIFNEWEFNHDELDLYLRVATEYVKTLPPRQRSLQMLTKQDVMEYCYNQMKYKQSGNKLMFDALTKTNDWLQSLADDVVLHLTKSHKPGALPNIIVYYKANKLSEFYIAFSKTCRRALQIIESRNPQSREHGPSNARLSFIRDVRYKHLKSEIESRIGDNG